MENDIGYIMNALTIHVTTTYLPTYYYYLVQTIFLANWVKPVSSHPLLTPLASSCCHHLIAVSILHIYVHIYTGLVLRGKVISLVSAAVQA